MVEQQHFETSPLFLPGLWLVLHMHTHRYTYTNSHAQRESLLWGMSSKIFKNKIITTKIPHKPAVSCISAWRAWTGRGNQAGRTGSRWTHGRWATPRWQSGTWCSCPACSPRRVSGRAGRGFLAALHLRTPPPGRQSSRCLPCRSPPWWTTQGDCRSGEKTGRQERHVTCTTLRQGRSQYSYK